MTLIRRSDGAALALLFALPAILLAPTLTGARVYFSGDLTHISHPWRTFVAEQLQKGEVPLWNPHIYFGHPLLANFQTGLFYPLSCLFHLFHFARALTPFLLGTYWLAALFGYLWLRRWGARTIAAAAGAAFFAAGGTMISFLQFPNLISTLGWLPALFLLDGSIAAAAFASALAFFAGYPPVWAGMTGAWLLLGGAWEGLAAPWRAVKATLAAMLLAAAALLPGAAFSRVSGRGEGQDVRERTKLALDPVDLLSVIHPEITRRIEERGSALESKELDRVAWTHDGTVSTFAFVTPPGPKHATDPSGIKYSPHVGGYLGAAGTLAALAGLVLLLAGRPLAGATTAGYVGLTLLICLGSANRISAWLWEHAPYLRQLRGPSRMTFLLLAVAPPLVALCIHRVQGKGGRRRNALAGLLAAGIAAELLATGWGFYPTEPRPYFAERGKLVDFLRGSLEGRRYFLFPETQAWPYLGLMAQGPGAERFRQEAYRGYKEKLFGISNVPFHLDAGGGGYEPLIFTPTERVLKALRTEEEKGEKLPDLLAWAGCRLALFHQELPPHRVAREAAVLPGRLLDRGEHLWYAYETPKNADRARWLPEDQEAALRRPFEQAGPLRGVPWRYERPREDRFDVVGDAPSPGILYVAEAALPGWKAYVNGRPAPVERALDAFMLFRVPAGPVRVNLVHRSLSFALGAAISVLALACAGVWGTWRLWSE